ncbi:hypothetical protein JMN32_22050 [Fulvivirga sp. 29W222]|uniref:Uncharacterized protein n=1 Tax=Fulvivirga marina TaxID=2494733 RepID=A0A937G2X2_9BACT|nr:hypothetical protein [Fulvivirga marina]MBL6449010.1 hypothetical protein [Fulvivirga marina]
MKNIITLVLVSAFIFSCGNSEKEADEHSHKRKAKAASTLKEDIIGEWRNIAMRVIIRGESADSVVNVPAGKWEEVLKIQPITTVFNNDGSFSSEYRDLDDAIIMTSTGMWAVNGDTLEMTQEGSTTRYTTKVEGGIVEFEGSLDWDEDGEADDYYWGKQEKQKE